MFLLTLSPIPEVPQFTFTSLLGANKKYKSQYTIFTLYDFDNEALDGQKCCEQCQLWHSTTNIVSSSIRQCRCGVDDGTATKESGSGWEGGSCIQDGSGKKKRSINNSLKRLKRKTVNLVKERIIDCVQTDNTGYWKYDYLIPEKCYSKFLIQAIYQYLIIFFF